MSISLWAGCVVCVGAMSSAGIREKMVGVKKCRYMCPAIVLDKFTNISATTASFALYSFRQLTEFMCLIPLHGANITGLTTMLRVEE